MNRMSSTPGDESPGYAVRSRLKYFIPIMQKETPTPNPSPIKREGLPDQRRVLPPLPSLWGKGPGDGGNPHYCPSSRIYPALLCIARCFSGGRIIRTLIIMLILLAALPAHAQESLARPDLALYPTLFKRDNPPASTDDSAQIIMVGDTSLARGVEEATTKYGMDYPLAQVSPWLQAADMAVGNYEGVIAADGVGKERLQGYRMRTQPNAAPALARAGFKLLNLANNHTMDWGPDGLQATLDNLHAAGIQTVGAGSDGEAARKPVVTTVRGVKIVWLAYTMVPEPRKEDMEGEDAPGWARAWFGPTFARDKLTAYVQAARQLGDMVIVQFHWGLEYNKCPQDWQYDLARTAIQAGAALVVGHHPHVVQSVEAYQKGFIAYSLGNFLFDQPQAPGLALWIRLDKQGVIDVHALTLRPGVQPDWNPPTKAATDLLGLCIPIKQPRTTWFGYTNGSYHTLAIQDNQMAPDWCSDGQQNTIREIGQIDLTGDGEPERVTIQNGALHVYEGDREVYTSHPSWQVVDASLGDPNQDGRFEVTMLLWKQDTPGAPVTTHPFILGYRGGQYKIIWGGSATDNWVQALGVADVDGDNNDELVTIERDPTALPCEARYRIVVMKWNGWGFTRQWISGYDYFMGLSFTQRDEIGGRLAIAAR